MSANVSDYQVTWVKEEFVDFLLEKINPLLGYKSVKAKVISIKKLPDSMVEVTLKPNRNYQKHAAGQFVFVTIEYKGVLHQRAYSIVSGSDDRYVVIAAKEQGLVSGYLANDLKVGQIIPITLPQGDFTLSGVSPGQPLLFIAGGSGITPMQGLIKEALGKGFKDITMLYYSRDPAYREDLEALAHLHPEFKLHIVVDSEAKPARFNEKSLTDIGVDLNQVHTFLCGAPGLMKAVNELWDKKGAADKLTQERFLAPEADENAESFPVLFRQKQKEFESQGNLLASAEAAGLKPAYGCRMGVCNTCVCEKVSGKVRNQLTGKISDQQGEQIKLCISEALSPLVIDA